MNTSNPTILLTIDVEDWFQVENFKKYISLSSWPSWKLRVEENTHRILDLLDSVNLTNTELSDSNLKEKNANESGSTVNPTNPCKLNDSTNTIHPKATFFILGWIAERVPNLVREIHSRGHEISSHGYLHGLCDRQSRMELEEDLLKSKKLLEEIIGTRIYGYRAPSFSVDNNILEIIKECGYVYDSSFNSFEMNKRYGWLTLTDNAKHGVAFQISESFYEIPISNLKFGKYVFPWGGGGYFRIIPFALFRLGVRSILKKHTAYIFYTHSWEIDSGQPTVKEASYFFKFRHYTNLSKTLPKLSSLIRAFKECRFVTCSQYIRSELWK